MAACGGKMVTNLPPIYCSSTGSASLFWPISSNLTRFQGMMVCSPGMSVATSASRIFSPSVDLARLIASAITRRPMNWRDVRSLKSLPDFSLYMALILPTIGRFAARSSEKLPREITPSSLSPTASYSAFSEKPVLCDDGIRLVAELRHGFHQQNAVGSVAGGHQHVGIRRLE